MVETGVNVYGMGVCYFYKPDLTLKDRGAGIPIAGQLLVGVGDKKSINGEFGLGASGMGLAAAVSIGCRLASHGSIR